MRGDAAGASWSPLADWRAFSAPTPGGRRAMAVKISSRLTAVQGRLSRITAQPESPVIAAQMVVMISERRRRSYRLIPASALAECSGIAGVARTGDVIVTGSRLALPPAQLNARRSTIGSRRYLTFANGRREHRSARFLGTIAPSTRARHVAGRRGFRITCSGGAIVGTASAIALRDLSSRCARSPATPLPRRRRSAQSIRRRFAHAQPGHRRRWCAPSLESTRLGSSPVMIWSSRFDRISTPLPQWSDRCFADPA